MSTSCDDVVVSRVRDTYVATLVRYLGDCCARNVQESQTFVSDTTAVVSCKSTW